MTTTFSKDERPRWLGNLVGAIVVLVLFAGIYLLPPDTSLAELERNGYLRACVPQNYPPLVQPNADLPGFEIELLQDVADRLGVRLVLNTNAAIGRELNPRNWQVSRANCQIIGGGIVDNATIRSFLDTTPPHLETGWVVLSPGDDEPSLQDQRVGVYVGITGRDRIQLSRLLRDQQAQIKLVNAPDKLVADMKNGGFDLVVTEALIGGAIAAEHGWTARWLPGDTHDSIAFGLWKGDLTLKRRINAIITDLQHEGRFTQLAARYGVAAIPGDN
ncbi:transporter substrate-binding domain-containing protein [Devosia sp. 2618]|uniref:substrate-binding periplasmic protein n=1 Tax=Devosia sp. 2618 TaxID=3156454 RepID=UPI003394FF92